MKSKFRVRYVESYIVELFGSQTVREPLLLKPISQKVKYNLKKVGNALQNEYKAIRQELKELFDQYSIEEVVEPTKEGEKPTTKRIIPEDKKEEFFKRAQELEDMDIEVEHIEFKESDFIDKTTNDFVAGNIYYNIVDILLGWEIEEPEEKEETKEEKKSPEKNELVKESAEQALVPAAEA